MGVFISYSSKDHEEANRLKTIIENNGFPCWMAPQSIPAGSDYSSEIPSAIRNCEAFILVLSAMAQNSIWVPKELDYALTCAKTIVPFHIDESDLIDSFNFRLSNVQRIEAFNRMSDAYQQLINKLIALGCRREDPIQSDSTFAAAKTQQISFNQRPGTEDFLQAKETDPEKSYKKGPIRVSGEKSFWILASILNDSPDENLIAENVRLKMSIHKTDAAKTIVKASIMSSNATPMEISSEISFISDRPFELRYLPGSALMYSEAYGLHGSKSMKLTDDILSEQGTLLGYRKPDGRIPGGLNNAVTASIQVMVSY